MQDVYVESLSGEFSDERLNEHWLATLADVHGQVANWRADYNQIRPHSAVEDVTPAEFAVAWWARRVGPAKPGAEELR